MALILESPSQARLAHAAIGAILMLAATMAATLAIPQDVVAPGSLTLSVYILVLGLIAPTITSWRNDMRHLLRGENILIAALIYWSLFEPLQGSYSALLSRDTVVRAYLLIAVTAIGFWLGATLWRPMAPRILVEEALHPWSSAAIFRALLMAFALGIWDFLYRADFDLNLISDALLQSRWNAPWQRESLGDWSAFSYHLQYFGYLVPPITAFLALRAGWLSPKAWVGVALSVTILAFHMQGGGRRIVGSMILAALFCWLIYARKLTLRRAVMVALSFGALVLLLQIMLIYRGIGFGDPGTALPQFDYVFVDDNFLRMNQMLEFVPDSHPFVEFEYVYFALVRPIPRVLWPGKPISGGFDLAELLGIPDTSLALTAAGEFYVSYGYLAALIGGLVYGRLATMVNELFRYPAERLNPLYPSLLLVWLFVGVRSMLEVMLMGYVLLAVIAISKMAGFVNSLRGQVQIPQKLPRIP